MRHRGISQTAIRIAAKHDAEAAGAGGVDHAAGFGETAGFHELDVNAVDVGSQGDDVAARKTAFVDKNGQRGVLF